MRLHPFISTGIRAGIRGKSIQSILFLGLLLIAIAFLAGNFSPRHPQTVALDVGLSLLRITLVFFGLFWVQELISKEIDKKTILFTLAYPCRRSTYLLTRYTAILTMLFAATVLLGSLLLIAVTYAGGQYIQQFPVNLNTAYWQSLLGLFLDAAVVTSFALVIATLSTTPLLPLALGFLFAVAGKGLGSVIYYLTSPNSENDQLAHQFTPTIEKIQWLLPDLSRLDWRISALYPEAVYTQPILFGTLMAISYIAIMLCLACLIFEKREFF